MIDIKGLLGDAFLYVKVPKYLVIKNTRLCLVQRIFQLAAFAYVLSNIFITKPWYKGYDAQMSVFSIWATGGQLAADEDLKYCTSPESFNYKWNEDYQYNPTGCKQQSLADSAIKQGRTGFFVPTFTQDTYKWSSSECNQQAAQNCQSSGGQYNVTGATCRCDRKEEYFFKDPESITLNFLQGYKVEYEDFFVRKHVQEDMAVLTRFHNDLGSVCNIGGRSDWTPESQKAGISAPLRDFLACASLDLDEPSDKIRSNTEGESKNAPTPRIAGASLRLEFKYENDVESWTDDVILKVLVLASPQWASLPQMSTLQAPFPDVNGESLVRDEYTYGVVVEAVGGGNMEYFNLTLLLTAIINMVVVLSLPGIVIQFIALYLIGLLSKVYKASACEILSISKKIMGICSRLSGYSASFRVMTHQLEGAAADLKGITLSGLQRTLKDILSSEMAAGGVLDMKELQILTKFLYKGMEDEDTGDISYEHFLRTCSANEPMDISLIAAMFDAHRRPSFLERLLSEKKVFDKTLQNAKDAVSNQSLIEMDGEDIMGPMTSIAATGASGGDTHVEEQIDQLFEQQEEVKNELFEAEEEIEAERKDITDLKEQLASLQTGLEELRSKCSSRLEEQAELISAQLERQAGLISELAAELKARDRPRPDTGPVTRPVSSSTWFSELFHSQGEHQDFQQLGIKFEALEAHVQARMDTLELQVGQKQLQRAGGSEEQPPVGLEGVLQKIDSMSGKVDHVSNKVTSTVLDLAELKGRFRYLDGEVASLSDAYRSVRREQSELATLQQSFKMPHPISGMSLGSMTQTDLRNVQPVNISPISGMTPRNVILTPRSMIQTDPRLLAVSRSAGGASRETTSDLEISF
eukprot:TRINITY_DN106563_c0_g1_i1.p1 TRINITY_DN106563_c0_g1~~TRINITY_DN106563_c0_g1_i1.p1  ORF type:complete len:888 (-),score=129.42 TRINITY_DN106563_c0_g1_i1:62-2656(-)